MGFLGSFQGSRGRLAEQLGQAIGGGLGELTGSYFANNALNSVIKDPALKDADAADRLGALQQKLAPFGQRGEKMLVNALKLEDKREEKMQQGLLAKGLQGKLQPEERGRLTQENQLKLNERERSMQLGNRVKQALLDRGMPLEQAEYYGELISSTEKGTGQSAVINDALNAANRYGSQPETDPFTQNAGSGKKSQINPDFEFPKPETQKGTPKERQEREDKFAQENIKLDMENRQRKRSLDEDHYSFKKLETLNPKISTGFSKWNINPLTGEPIIPAQATPEEREYGKILVQQLRNAKDTFGARITNFDAQKYLEGFPNLADSPEARAAIIKDLLKVNEINRLYAQAQDEVYRTYKPGQISPSEANRVAEDIVRPKVDALWTQYSQGQYSNNQGLKQGEVQVTYEGQKYAIPQNELDQWLKAGAKQ